MKVTMSAKVDKNKMDEVQQAAHQAELNALLICALIAESYAVKKCPYDTGRLRGSISHGVSEEEMCGFIGTNVEYAPYVEYGTIKMKARPFFKPAVNDHQDEYRAIIEECMKNA